MKTRSHWGWGHTEDALRPEARQRLGMLLSTRFDMSQLSPLTRVAELSLPPSRLRAPSGLALSVEPLDRAGHTYGKAFRDVVRGMRGDFSVAPDAVARPDSSEELERILAWCAAEGVAAIPYGGGSSVVGGVEARCRDDFAQVVSIDMERMSGLIELDTVSRAARFAGGTYGPALEAALKPHGLTLRHYPQSFEFSTLGGWIATRAGGHFATLYTHIDDLVSAIDMLTPAGMIATRRLPASGAGPSPERAILGSEGAFGIIVSAWVKLFERPTFRASASLRFDDFYRAAEAARLLAQSGLYPSNCRLLDPYEALINGIGDGETTFLLVAFESADHPLQSHLARALEIAEGAGGRLNDRDALRAAGMPTADIVDGDDADPSDRWRKMFLRGPYLRDALVELGMITETFETAVTWDRFEAFHRRIGDTARDAVNRICGGGVVSSRVTHVYPDGAAPYFTVVAPAKAQSQIAQWDEIKAAVSDAIVDAGGTITHHHAVGRDHREHHRRERPALFGDALVAMKRTLDPAGIMNPGVLI